MVLRTPIPALIFLGSLLSFCHLEGTAIALSSSCTSGLRADLFASASEQTVFHRLTRILRRSFETKPQKLYPFEKRSELEKLSPALKTALLHEIGKRYVNAKKNSGEEIASGLEQHWEKRILDAWIRVLLQPEKVIQEALDQGKSPLEAYQTYRDLVRSSLFTPEMEALHYGFLTAQDLLEISKAIYEDFRLVTKVYGQGVQIGLKVYLFGSCLKGLEKDGSDLDMAVDVGTLIQLFRRNLIHGEEDDVVGMSPKGMKGVSRIVQEVMKQRHPGLILKADYFSSLVRYFGNMSITSMDPMIIEINEDGVFLRVYSGDIKRAPKEGVLFDVQEQRYRNPRQDYEADPEIRLKLYPKSRGPRIQDRSTRRP